MGSAMNEKQIYLARIQFLLNSPWDEQIAILRNYLELIDDKFTSVLREWATQTLAEMESEAATNLTINIINFSNNLIQDFPLGSKSSNMEIAIAGYEVGLQVFKRDTYAEYWADIQNNLANAYSNRIKGERGENIEKAIALYASALQVRTRYAFPQGWAETQNNLALAYSNRIQGERGENIERAIAFYEAALEVRTPTALPIDCLRSGQNLGDLGFAESLWETAIFGYEKAIEAVEQSREWITSDNRKREIIEENLDVYEKMMQSCINHQQYDKALQTIERSKSRYLVELFTNSEIYPKTATETEKQQLQNLRRQIAASQQLLETETPSPPPLSPPPYQGGTGGGSRILSLTTHNPNPQPQPRIFPTTKSQIRNNITATNTTARTDKTARTRIHPNSKSRTHRHHQIPTNLRHRNSNRRMVHRQ